MAEATALFEKDNISAFEAKDLAQWIAFAPMVFQAARVLRNSGILEAIQNAYPNTITLPQILESVSVSEYGARVLLESGLSIGLVTVDAGGRYGITKTGCFILNDDLTRVNMDFVHDVCYKAMFSLDKSVETGVPVGLSLFGNWNTIYEGLSQLPLNVQNSWFAFDHYFSDDAFDKVLDTVMAANPKHIADIGGNTGKFAVAIAKRNPGVAITIIDLPGQLNMAKTAIAEEALSHRISFYPANILETESVIPNGFDCIWMSQFLDCFSEEQIGFILSKCHAALEEDGILFIMEPFWDRQKFRTAAFCLHQTSLYFTALANGNSQMYPAAIFKKCLQKSGFIITEQQDQIGLSQTLLTCRKA